MDEQYSTPPPDDPLSKDTNVSPEQEIAPEQQSEDTREEQLYRQALEERMQQLKRDQLDTEESLTNLGLLFHTRIKYGEVMPLDERALTIYEYLYGRNHPEVATHLHQLANYYMNSGEYGLAKPLYEQALTLRQQNLSPDHLDTAATLYALAKLYQQQEKYTQAVPLHAAGAHRSSLEVH